MLKQSLSEPNYRYGAVPLNLSSILLVESDPTLRDSRRLLLSALRHRALAVSAYAEVCALPADSNCGPVAIDICPDEHEASRIVVHARRTCPNAKILLLGHPSDDFDDRFTTMP